MTTTSGTKTSHQAVSTFAKRVRAYALLELQNAGKVRVRSVEEAMELIEASLEYLEKKENGDNRTELTGREKMWWSEKGAWVDRLFRLQGLYAPDTQVNVQANIIPAEEFWGRIRGDRDDEE